MRKVKVKCRRCSSFLLSEESLVDIEATSFNVKSEDGQQICEEQVKTHLFLLVDLLPEWVTAAVIKSLYSSGKVTCPKCGGRLGSFNFLRQACMCGCGKRNLSPVHFLRDRIDMMYMDFAVNTSLSSPGPSLFHLTGEFTNVARSAGIPVELQEVFSFKEKHTSFSAFSELKLNPELSDMIEDLDAKHLKVYKDLNDNTTTRDRIQVLARTETDSDKADLGPQSLSVAYRCRQHHSFSDDQRSGKIRTLEQACVLQQSSPLLERGGGLNRRKDADIVYEVPALSCDMATGMKIVQGHRSPVASDAALHTKNLSKDTLQRSSENINKMYFHSCMSRMHLLDHEDQSVSPCQRESHNMDSSSAHNYMCVGTAVQTYEEKHQEMFPANKKLLCSGSSMASTSEVEKEHSLMSLSQCLTFAEGNSDEVVCLNLMQNVATDDEVCISSCSSRYNGGHSDRTREVLTEHSSRHEVGPLLHSSNAQTTYSEKKASVTDSEHTVQELHKRNKKKHSAYNDCSDLDLLHKCLNNVLSSSSSSDKCAFHQKNSLEDRADIHCFEEETEESGGFKSENRFQALQEVDYDYGARRVSEVADKTVGLKGATLRERKTLKERMEEARATETVILESEEVPLEFTCAVCLEVMLCPHTTLPCRHDFCSSCLRQLAVSTPVGTKCPLCREIIVKCIPNTRLSRSIQMKYPVHVKARKRQEKRSFRNSPLPGSFLPQNLLQHLRNSHGARAQLGASRRKLVFLAFNIMIVIMLSTIGMVICRHVLAIVEEALDTIMEKLTGEKLWSEFMGVESRIATVSTIFVLYLVSASMVRFFKLFRQIDN